MGICFSKGIRARTPRKEGRAKSQDSIDAESAPRSNPARSQPRTTDSTENQQSANEEQLNTDALPEEGSPQVLPHPYILKEQLPDSAQKTGKQGQATKSPIGFPMASQVPLFPVSDSEVKLTFPLPFSANKPDPYDFHKEICLKITHDPEGIHMEKRIKLSETATSLYESVRKELKSPRKFTLLYMGRVIPEDQRAIGEFRVWESEAVSLIVTEQRSAS